QRVTDLPGRVSRQLDVRDRGRPGARGRAAAARGVLRARAGARRRRRRDRRGGGMRDPVALAHRLVDIPSVSGEEAEAARFVAGHLADLGYQVEVFEAAPGRPNVLATTDRSPRVVLSTHLDTVPPHLPAREEAGFLQGRSAIDLLLDMLADVRRSAWPTDPFFGDTTVNIGVIAGGSRPNVVAGEARADLQIRLVTDADPVKRLLGQVVGGRARIEYL